MQKRNKPKKKGAASASSAKAKRTSAASSKKTAAKKPAGKKLAKRKIKRARPSGWWGQGRSPHIRWPGVTIPLDEGAGKYWFDKEEADRAADFFPEFLVHTTGELQGQPFVLSPVQKLLIIRPVFGWKRVISDLPREEWPRRFKKVLIFVPKKFGKSLLGSGIALYLGLCDGEPGAQIGSAAADREQAGIVFNDAKYMVEENEDLKEICNVFKRVIEVPETNATYKVLSSDVKTKHGPNWHGLIFDELHALPNRDLYETLTRGTVSRRQPLTVEFTTAGHDRETICGEEYEYAKKLMSGVNIDDTFLPVIFEADPKADWRKPSTWKKANPHLGVSPKLSALRDSCQEAFNEPRKRNEFLRLHLNLWTQIETAWLDIHEWDACKHDISPEDHLGEICCGGVDLSTYKDLTAFALAFKRFDEDERPSDAYDLARGVDERGDVDWEKMTLNYNVDLFVWFWMPEASIHKREREDQVPYALWAEQGLLTPTPGASVDYDLMLDQIDREILNRIVRGEDGKEKKIPKYQLHQIGFDEHSANMFANALIRLGYPAIVVAQTVLQMSAPAKLLEALIISGRLRHTGNACLDWCASNVAAKEDKKGNIFPFKAKERLRIDGIIAGIIALNRMIDMPAPPQPAFIYSG